VTMLTPQDEGFHDVPPGIDRWQENFFFILWDESGANGFMVHLQRVPGLGVQEAQAVASVGGRLASANIRRPFDAHASVPELPMRAVQPYAHWQVSAEFDAVEGRGPFGFVFHRTDGPLKVTADLTLESALPVTDFAQGLHQVVEALGRDPSSSQMGQQEHYEQGGTWHGRLRIGDDEVEASGLFVRDHSWGVRHEQNEFQAFWTATCVDEGKVFANAIGIRQRDRVVGIGARTDLHGTEFTTEVGAVYTPEPGVCSYDRSRVEYGAGVDQVVEGTTQVHLPMYLPLSGARRYDNNAISAVTMDGKRGFAVMEFASVLTAEQARVMDASVGLPA